MTLPHHLGLRNVADGPKWIPDRLHVASLVSTSGMTRRRLPDKVRLVAGYVYILASKKNGTLYVGVTSDLGRRIWEHKQRANSGFTARYGAHRLVWYREFFEIGDAIVFEKQIKKWRRNWKIALIEEMNPDWSELYGGMGW